MKRERTFGKTISTTYVLVLAWNGSIIFYHFLWGGIIDSTILIMQTTALLTEWLVTKIYEDRIFMNNIIVDSKWGKEPVKKSVNKYWRFTTTFAMVFGPMYILRVLIFYSLGWNTGNQLSSEIITTLLITCIVGPVLGPIIIWRKKDQKKKLLQKQQQNRIRVSSSG